ncbi:hypothetical protein WDW37_07805 [Bdellovibrionota bacterium FG-1]
MSKLESLKRRFWRDRMWIDVLFGILALAALKRMFRDSEAYAEDFHVYWKAAHIWLAGGNPYAFTTEDHGFVFKYPPWILPLFLPIGALSWEAARHSWFGIEVLCLAYTLFWCVHQGVPRRLACFVGCLFWWMIHAHFAAGQFTLILLTASLWAYPADLRPQDPATLQQGTGFREGLLAWVLSAKVFSLFTLGGIWRRFLRPAPWLWASLIVITSHAILVLVSWKTGQQSLTQYYRDFSMAASSGGSQLGAEIVRGQGNHGLTALILRTLKVSSLSATADIVTAGSLALILGTLWQRNSARLTEAERWAGWIALALIVHPLAWHHSFVLAYPLCTLAVARAVKIGNRRLIAIAILGTCCIGIFIPQVLGKTLVKPLELAGIKSWGVIIAAISLVLSAKETRT